MNGGTGTGMVDFFHGFQVALMLTVMFNLTQFVWWRCKQSRRGTCLQVHQPTLWTLAATILVNIQPMWILIIGSWSLCCNYAGAGPTTGKDALPGGSAFTNSSGLPLISPSGYSFQPWPADPDTIRECAAPGGNVFWDVSYCSGAKLSVFPTVAAGWVIQILCTWGGFVFMFIGVMQATQLHVKLKKQWRQIRTGQR